MDGPYPEGGAMTPLKISLLALVLAFSSVAFAGRYALLIGNDQGGEGTSRLKYANNDLNAFRSVLTSLCGFSEENVVTLFNGTPGDLSTSFSALSGRISAKDSNALFLLYYTGHADDENLKMGPERFPLRGMKQVFSAVPAGIRICVFDACQSGAFTRLKGGTLAEPFLYRDDEKIQGQVVLSSSSADENSQESDLYRASIFTFHLINALRGGGDASSDGKVTLTEAYNYSYRKTIAATVNASGGVQHPAYQFRIQGEGDIVLADLTLRTAGLDLAADLSGTLTVMDAQSNVAAELQKERGQRVFVALNPGACTVVRTTEAGRSSAVVSIAEKTVLPLAAKDFSPMREQALGKKGGGLLERLAFGVTVSGGFDRMDLGSPYDSIAPYFSDFSIFGLRPEVRMPYNSIAKGLPWWAISLEGWVNDRFQAVLSFRNFSYGSKKTWESSRVNPFDNKAYPVSLTLDHQLDVLVTGFALGWKLHEGYLKNVMIQAGLETYSAEFSIDSKFTDALYDVSGGTSFSDEGDAIVLPFVGIGYRVPLTRRFSASLMAHYRFQDEALTLSSGDDMGDPVPAMESRGYGYYYKPDFLFDFGGLDIGLNLTFYLFKKN